MNGAGRRLVVAVMTAGTIWSLSGSLVPGSPLASQSNSPEHQFAGWQSVQQQRSIDEAVGKSTAEAAARSATTQDLERSVAPDLLRP